MDSERRTLHIKIIVNPHATKSFSLKFELETKKIINLKIMIPNVSDLNSVVEEIKKNVPSKHNYDIQFNWKNVPQSIKEDSKFQEDILKIFYIGMPYNKILTENSKGVKEGSSVNILCSDSDLEFSKLAAIVKMHNEHYGSAPDFKNNFTEKNKIKINNYIKSVLGMPKLTIEQTNVIAELLTK